MTPQNLDQIRARFASWDSKAETSMRRFLDVLVKEDLIHATDDAGGGAASSGGSERLVFEDPVIEKYSDMKAILLADPIHDVEEEGWPKVKAQS